MMSEVAQTHTEKTYKKFPGCCFTGRKNKTSTAMLRKYLRLQQKSVSMEWKWQVKKKFVETFILETHSQRDLNLLY